MMDFITKPFGVLMEFLYTTIGCHNYGITLIFFTIFVRIVLLPLNVKQQKSLERQQAIMPELEALKKQYKDDTRKLQEEQANLYAKYRVNPYGGCLPTLVQFPLIIIIYKIIRMPLTFISGLSSAVVKSLADIAGTVKDNEIVINNWFIAHPDDLIQGVSKDSLINMKFLKIFDLGVTPSFKFWAYGDQWKTYLPLLLIPILALATQYLLQAISTNINNGGKNKDKKTQDPTASSMSLMTKILPLMTLFFAFALPAGLGFYWTISNLLGILQTVLIKKVFNPRKKEGNI